MRATALGVLPTSATDTATPYIYISVSTNSFYCVSAMSTRRFSLQHLLPDRLSFGVFADQRFPRGDLYRSTYRVMDCLSVLYCAMETRKQLRKNSVSPTLRRIVTSSSKALQRLGVDESIERDSGFLQSPSVQRRASRRRDPLHTTSIEDKKSPQTDICFSRKHGSPPPLLQLQGEPDGHDATKLQQYIDILEREIAAADCRHSNMCRVLYDTAVRAAISEFFMEELHLRFKLTEQQIMEWDELRGAVLRRTQLEVTVLQHRVRLVSEENSILCTYVNPIASSTAQAYVLNDLRQVIDSHHQSQCQAVFNVEANIKGLVETHAAALHLALAKLQERFSQLLSPLQVTLDRSANCIQANNSLVSASLANCQEVVVVSVLY